MSKDNFHLGKDRNPLISFRGRIWIDENNETFLGYGRIVLLEKIREYGSITKAAKSMEMSYRHAWQLIDSMNRHARKPLIEAFTGGKGGGGARLTEEGDRVVDLFWKFYEDFQEFLKLEEEKLLSLNPQKAVVF
jgi:molybdate transport system regulatory protein